MTDEKQAMALIDSLLDGLTVPADVAADFPRHQSRDALQRLRPQLEDLAAGEIKPCTPGLAEQLATWACEATEEDETDAPTDADQG